MGSYIALKPRPFTELNMIHYSKPQNISYNIIVVVVFICVSLVICEACENAGELTSQQANV